MTGVTATTAVVMLATGNHIKLPNSLFLTVHGSIFSGEPSSSVTILLLATLWAMDTLAIQTTRNICRKSFYMQSNPGLLFFYCYTVSDSTFLRIPSTKLQTVEQLVSCVYGNNNLSAYKVLSDELKVSMAPRDSNTTYPVAAWHSHLIRLLSVGYFCLFYTTVTFSLNDCSTMM